MVKKIVKIALPLVLLCSMEVYAETTDLYLNFVKNQHVDKDVRNFYKVQGFAGDIIESKLDNLSADVDLYVKIGKKPIEGDWHCKSIHGGTKDDVCRVTLTEDSDVYIAASGYSAADYSVTATLIESQVKQIGYDQEVFGITPRLEHRDYKIHANAGDVLKIRAYGMDADGDLYVKLGSKARRGGENNLASSHQNGLVDEEVTIEIDNDTDVYIALYADESCIHTVEHHIKVTRTNDIKVLNSGDPDSDYVALNRWKYYKITASAGDTVESILNGLDADADLYVKVGEKPTKENKDCRSTNGGISADTCSVTVSENTDVYIGVFGYRATDFTISVDIKNGDIYGQIGKYTVSDAYEADAPIISYYPLGVDNTPVILLLTGWQKEIDIDIYKDLLQFIASHGYTAVGVPWNVNIEGIKKVLKRHDDDLDLSRIGIIGHSIGGGYSFSYMKSLIEDDYGTNGRFILPMDPMYAFDMYKSDMSQLINTNLLMMKFNSRATDPRVSLMEYNLFNGVDIKKKNYIVLDKKNHSYCTGDVSAKKDLLLPLGALMAYTFKNDNNAYPYALSGENKENPYRLEKVYSESYYSEAKGETCTWSTQEAQDRGYESDINFCGEPYIVNN